MFPPENFSIPPFDWSDQDIAFVATEISREFPRADPHVVAAAVEQAARHVPAAEGRVMLAKSARQVMRGVSIAESTA